MNYNTNTKIFIKTKKITVILLMILLTVHLIKPEIASAQGDLNQYEAKIDEYVSRMMEAGNIPGLSLSVVKDGESIIMKSYGYSDIKHKIPMDNQMRYQLASNSKAYTALGIVLLVNKGLISLEAPVTDYIDWFEVYWNGSPARITVRSLLYHTSGIPFETIGIMSDAEKGGALEETVRTLKGTSLVYEPDRGCVYASINYDVLGLIIESVTGQSYEDYIRENILLPLKLNNTGFISDDENNLTVGHKPGFFKAVPYKAPDYYGNIPAGYLTVDIGDFTTWMKIQLGSLELPEEIKQAVSMTHEKNYDVYRNPDGSLYTMGWLADWNGGGDTLISGGNNPNYCSFMILDEKNQSGVAVLSNMSSAYVESVGIGVLDIVNGQEPKEKEMSDMYYELDRLLSTAILACLGIILLLTVIIGITAKAVKIGKRKKCTDRRKVVVYTVAAILFLTIVGFLLIKTPPMIFYGLDWSFIMVWAPVSMIPALCTVYILFIAIVLLVWFRLVYKKAKVDSMSEIEQGKESFD